MSTLCHFALQKIGIRPSVLLGIKSPNDKIDRRERAFIFGSIQLRAEAERKEAQKAKAATRKR